MKKFRSRLQSLQRLREQQEQLARARVGVCQQQRQAAEDRVHRLLDQQDATSENVHSLLSQQVGVETFNGSRALYQQQQAQLEAAGLQLQLASAAVDQALNQWHAAQSELKAITGRIDMQRAAHRRETFLQEEHRQQETAAQSRHRRTAETSGVSES